MLLRKEPPLKPGRVHTQQSKIAGPERGSSRRLNNHGQRHGNGREGNYENETFKQMTTWNAGTLRRQSADGANPIVDVLDWMKENRIDLLAVQEHRLNGFD